MGFSCTTTSAQLQALPKWLCPKHQAVLIAFDNGRLTETRFAHLLDPSVWPTLQWKGHLP